MRKLWATAAVLASLAFVLAARAGEGALHLATATGAIEKVDKGKITVQPRGAGGKFEKKLILKVTGTTKLTIVNQEKRKGKLVPVQRDVEMKDLAPGQNVSVIYATGGESVLLAAVVQKAAPK